MAGAGSQKTTPPIINVSSQSSPSRPIPICNDIISLRHDNRPHASMRVNGRTVIALLDSGAQLSVAGNDFHPLIRELNLKTTEHLGRVKTADGAQHTAQSLVEIPIEFGGQTAIIHALLVPSIAKSLILGMDFWEAFKIQPVICGSVEVEKDIVVSGSCVMDEATAARLQNVLKKMPFAKPGLLSRTNCITHTIDTGNATPIKQRQYVVSPYLQVEISKEIDRLLGMGVIYACPPSAWNNPVVAVKKSSGAVRLCLDARKLNAVTTKDAYPTQQINRILGRLTGTKVLSSIDFSDAFLQVPLEKSSQPKTAFSISGRGYFAYARMPFGLCNSAATLCRLVDQIVGCDLEPKAFVYLDDIIIATNTFEEHFEVLEKIADRLANAGLTISVDKSRFCMESLRYLGYVVSEKGISPDPEKISSIVSYPVPKCVKDVRRLLGVVGWYRRFIPQFSSITAPLTNMLKKSRNKFEWSETAAEAFESIKKVLTSEPILANPIYDEPFIIQTDASNLGVGAVLLQGCGESERVISYFSRKLSSAEQKYQTTERECLAVINAIDKFRPYIEGVKFTVVTDHASLQWLQNLRDPAGRLGRWALRLQAHDFVLVHRKGSLMVVPDALSRAIDAIDVSLFVNSDDPWYNALLKHVQTKPEKYQQFRVENGLLYKYCERGKKSLGYSLSWRMVVPESERLRVLRESHDEPVSGHGGFFKTLDRVRRKYFWPDMHSEIRRYVAKCEVCKASKHTNVQQRAPMGEYREATRAWQMLYTDFIGPLPRSRSGFSYIFVVVDAYTKFVHLTSLRQATSKAVIKVLRDEIFYVHGVPQVVVCDNGKQFVSGDFKKFLEGFDVKLWLISRYHPQANAAEAANKTIGTTIRAYTKEGNHQDWDKYLKQISCAMNTATHSSTKMSPYFINYGQNMILSGKEYAAPPLDSDIDLNRDERFREIRKTVGRKLRAAYEKGKYQYDLKSREVVYEPGSTVWKRNFVLSDASKGISAKLSPKYVKCLIKAKVGSSSYELTDFNGKSLGVFSSRHLKAN